MRRALVALFLTILPCTSAAQAAGEEARWREGGIGTMASIERHRQILSGIPAPYRFIRSPLGQITGKTARGAALFEDHCTSCHGSIGRGNGPKSRTLFPHPADLSWLAKVPAGRADPFMYWSIAEGGAEFHSDMPAFKSKLSSGDIWAIINYIRLNRSNP